MGMKVKAKCINENFSDGDFKIFWWTPLQTYDNLKVNPRGMTFSTKGKDSYITVGKEYELELEEISSHKIYGGTYKIIDVPSIKLENVENLTLEESKLILEEITTESQTDYLLSAYPNFIELALTIGIDAFDIKTIHNVGEYRLNAYVRNLVTKYRYLALMGRLKDYYCDIGDCGKLLAEYKTEDLVFKAIKENPYYVLVKVLGRSFLTADKIIMEIRPDLKNSDQRCEFIILTTLELNESGDGGEWFVGGNTKLSGKKMWEYSRKYAPEVSNKMLDVCIKSDLIHFDEDTNELACMSTYLMEKNIAEFTKSKLQKNNQWDIEWNKYKEIKDGTLTDEQSEILRSVCENDITIVNSKGGSGKAQPNDTLIPTPNGHIELGKLKVGDYVYDRKGKPTKILGVYPQGKLDCYKVTLSDKRFTYCNDEHLWTYYGSRGNLKTETLKEMMNRSLLQNSKAGYRYKIPTNEAIEKEHNDKLFTDPYVIGCFIGNGCCRENVLTISSNSEENVSKLAKILSCSYKKMHAKNYSWSFFNEDGYLHTKDIVPMLYKKYSYEKEIPKEYLDSSIEQRFELLRGLLDTDGSICKNGKRLNVRYSTTSKKLKDNMLELLFSLGLKATVRKDTRDKYTSGCCYDIHILCDNDLKSDLFSISYKKEIALMGKSIKANRKYDRVEIVNIEKMNYQKEMTCIMVDNEEHLYLTNDYIVTHNTSVVMAIIKMLEDNNKSYLLLSPTGRVASRIKEQTSREAQTIHMACLMGSINVDFLLIEEYSMVGVELLNILINSIKNPNCKLLFNGHLGQISPIQCGCPMRDMVNGGVVPTLSLSKVFRYGEGGLYKMATDADNGKFYLEDLDYMNKDRISIGVNNDYTYIRYNGEIEQVIEEYKKLLERGIKPIDISVVTIWNITDFGSINLNNKIQELVNPKTENGKYVEIKVRGFDVLLKVGDIILNTKNCYDILTFEGYELIKKDKLLSKEDVPRSKVMNGEIGKIVNIDNGYIIAKFGEELLVFDKLKQRELLLAYVLTSFKLQGSENLHIISLITPQFKKTLSKNIIYTDMSRARKEVVEIIDPIVLEEAIKIDTTNNRETNLTKLLTP